MARQYSVDFDWIKRNADFRAILDHYGIAAVGQGEQVRIKCPFHDDRNPSCSVNWAENLFSCKAASCERQGNIIQFVQWMESDEGGSALSTRDAAKLVAQWSGIETRPPQGRQGSQERRKGCETAREPKNGREAADGAPRAENEVAQRRIDADSTAQWLARNPLDTEHPYLRERIGGWGMKVCSPCGYVAKGKLAGYAMLPVHDMAGQVVAMIGRWADGELPEGKEKYRFPPGLEKSAHLFGLWQCCKMRGRQTMLYDGTWLVLVEGPFDAIALQWIGKPAMALLGSSLSDRQLEIIKQYCPRVRHVAVLMDGDEGGRAAADRIAVKLSRHGLWAKILDLPDSTDPETASRELIDELMPLSARREAA